MVEEITPIENGLENDVFDAYVKWKQSQEEEDKLHKEFTRLADMAYQKGIKSVNGMNLVRVEKNISKLDVTMFRTLHEDRYKELVDSGSVTIPMSAIKGFKDEISDCIDVKQSVFFTLEKSE